MRFFPPTGNPRVFGFRGWGRPVDRSASSCCGGTSCAHGLLWPHPAEGGSYDVAGALLPRPGPTWRLPVRVRADHGGGHCNRAAPTPAEAAFLRLDDHGLTLCRSLRPYDRARTCSWPSNLLGNLAEFPPDKKYKSTTTWLQIGDAAGRALASCTVRRPRSATGTKGPEIAAEIRPFRARAAGNDSHTTRAARYNRRSRMLWTFTPPVGGRGAPRR